MLKEWGNDINKKSEEEKRSLKGKVASAMHAQTVTYMKPMFRKLKSRVSIYDSLSFLAHQIGISAVFTHVNLTYPYQPMGKIK